MYLLLEDIAVVSRIFTVVCPLELNTGQIQEGMGEAINGIVKHFHKPEKEVKYYFLWNPTKDKCEWISTYGWSLLILLL